MINLDFLIGTQDITSIDIQEQDSTYSLVFTFEWEMDCGCFTYAKNSNLTVKVPKKSKKKIEELKDKKGIIYQYIKNHKEYVGEFLDLEVNIYED